MSGFVKITAEDSGYAPFSMFGSAGGQARYLINDNDGKKYVGLFKADSPLPEDNEWLLDVDEYLTVTEGEITIEFLPQGETVVLGAGELGFIPAGSRIHLTLSKLPYAETFVMIAPSV
jgi:ethanolamine utilization protein EutQ (cupin superfamily)